MSMSLSIRRYIKEYHLNNSILLLKKMRIASTLVCLYFLAVKTASSASVVSNTPNKQTETKVPLHN